MVANSNAMGNGIDSQRTRPEVPNDFRGHAGGMRTHVPKTLGILRGWESEKAPKRDG